MPLKTQLRDSNGGVLEQIVFTSLQDARAHPRTPSWSPASMRTRTDGCGSDTNPVDAHALSVSWQADTLPAGFRMTASARQMLPAGPVEHLVFSDGLASVSVFVEIGRAGG